MKKLQLSPWSNVTEKLQCKADSKVVELKDGICLFARLSVVGQSRTDIDTRELVGISEFCAIPKALKYTIAKNSELMHILEWLPMVAGSASIQTDTYCSHQ